MQDLQKINENIYRMTLPYKDIFTTVYLIKTEEGALLFDAASYDEDIPEYIIPFLNKLGITKNELKYVFISHNHKDHAGGLAAFMNEYPKTCIISGSDALMDTYKDCKFLFPSENETVLGVLKVIKIPGHTKDSAGILDTRTNTLISGDSLQLYGIFGSGKWAANISFTEEHFKAIDKLRNMDIEMVLTAHDYHPYGYMYCGKEKISQALDACINPLLNIKEIILNNPEADDEKVCKIYNSAENLPTLGPAAVKGMREFIKKER